MMKLIKKAILILTKIMFFGGIIGVFINAGTIMFASPHERLENSDKFDAVWQSLSIGIFSIVVSGIVLIGLTVYNVRQKIQSGEFTGRRSLIGRTIHSSFDGRSPYTRFSDNTAFHTDNSNRYNNNWYSHQMQEQQRQMQEQMRQMQDEQNRQFTQWSMEETMKASTPIDQGGYSPNDSFNSFDSFGGFGGFGNF